jgi:hypothetical protein
VAGLLPARNGERDLLELRATERGGKFHRGRSGLGVVLSDLAGTRWSEAEATTTGTAFRNFGRTDFLNVRLTSPFHECSAMNV